MSSTSDLRPSAPPQPYLCRMHQCRRHQVQTEQRRTDGRIFPLIRRRPSPATASPRTPNSPQARAAPPLRSPRAQAFLPPSQTPARVLAQAPKQTAIPGVPKSPPASSAIAHAASRAAHAIPRFSYRLMRLRAGPVPPLLPIQLPPPVRRLSRTLPTQPISEEIPNHILKAPMPRPPLNACRAYRRVETSLRHRRNRRTNSPPRACLAT